MRYIPLSARVPLMRYIPLSARVPLMILACAIGGEEFGNFTFVNGLTDENFKFYLKFRVIWGTLEDLFAHLRLYEPKDLEEAAAWQELSDIYGWDGPPDTARIAP